MNNESKRQELNGTHNRVEQVPVCQLKPAGRNARTHSRAQIEKIAASIERFGLSHARKPRNQSLDRMTVLKIGKIWFSHDFPLYTP